MPLIKYSILHRRGLSKAILVASAFVAASFSSLLDWSACFAWKSTGTWKTFNRAELSSCWLLFCVLKKVHQLWSLCLMGPGATRARLAVMADTISCPSQEEEEAVLPSENFFFVLCFYPACIGDVSIDLWLMLPFCWLFIHSARSLLFTLRHIYWQHKSVGILLLHYYYPMLMKNTE